MARIAGTYLLGGIVLSSELPLPELPLMMSVDARAPRVDVRVGAAPSTLLKSVEIDPDCFANSDQYLLRVRGIGTYFVSQGTEIIVQPEKNALALDVRAYLLGIVFSVLCHQRGLLPLHASAISTPQGVVAFLAPSGHGKSSLAAHMAQRGFPVVADDICLMSSNEPKGKPMVIPVAPWLKLWRASLQQLGQPPEGLEQVFSEDDKYRFPVSSGLERQPIGKLIFLERNERRGVELQELSGVHALVPLFNLVHQSYLLEAMGRREEVFRHCGGILSQAKAYKMIRPWGFTYMDSVVERIEELLQEDLPARSQPANAVRGKSPEQ